MRSYENEIGHSIRDLNRLNHSPCVYLILFEEDHKPPQDPQEKSNPIFGKVKKKEVLNLRNTDIMYLTSTREWEKEVRNTPNDGDKVAVENCNNLE